MMKHLIIHGDMHDLLFIGGFTYFNVQKVVLNGTTYRVWIDLVFSNIFNA